MHTIHTSMQRAIRGAALFLALAGTMAPAAGQAASAARTDAQEHAVAQARRIEGAWVLQVTVVDCATRHPAGPTFRSLVTFVRGGTLTNTTTGINPALRTPGLGTWEKTGDHQFSAFSVVFLFNPAGVWAMTQTIANSLEIGTDPNEVSGTTDVHFYDTADVEIVSMRACATVLGRRLN